MKSQIKGFISGALVSALVLGGAVSALAVSGNISFNLSAIKFNGEVISEAGEGYTLPNGCVAPASITYTDEKGGGTTYLPARRVSELLGVDIGWDAASGAVTIGKTEQPVTPDTTANVPDYSDWSAEDEAAYQEFKGMWEVECVYEERDEVMKLNDFVFSYEGQPKDYSAVMLYWDSVVIDDVSEYMTRWIEEIFKNHADKDCRIELSLLYGQPTDKDYVAFATVNGSNGKLSNPLVHKIPYSPSARN